MTAGPKRWEWPDDLDAVVAASEHHSVLLENDRVRVLNTRVESGDTVPVHTHRWPSVQYVLSIADFVRRDADGHVLADSRSMELPKETPFTLWSEPIPPHTLENVGERIIHVLAIELKDSPDEVALDER
ncbi:MAG: hypothetical protein HW413_1130 [Thermoleophilia bacterium]|nr:hypothetical protein [Thermoleophilia bacterium]